MKTVALIISCLLFTHHPIRNSSFTQEDILSYLERGDQETYHFFINFEHPYFYTAGSRLTLYADETRWAIVFEKSGYSTGGYTGELDLFFYGNCLRNLQSGGDAPGVTSNMKTKVLIGDDEIRRIEEDYAGLVKKDIRQVRVRDSLLQVEQDPLVYQKRGIVTRVDRDDPGMIDLPSMIRLLDEEHPDIFRATDAELKQCLPEDLPKLMQINEWHHEAYDNFKQMTSPSEYQYLEVGEKPGDYETYRMIADILVSRDTSRWKPTLKPNNNWRNWPKGGKM